MCTGCDDTRRRLDAISREVAEIRDRCWQVGMKLERHASQSLPVSLRIEKELLDLKRSFVAGGELNELTVALLTLQATVSLLSQEIAGRTVEVKSIAAPPSD